MFAVKTEWWRGGGLLLAALLHISHAAADWYERTEDVMGTRVSVELWHDDEQTAQRLMGLVIDEMRRIDRGMSPYIETSELSLINREAAKHPVVLSEEMFRVIDKAQYYSRISNGAFDISFASVGHYYDYRQHRQPSEQQIAEHLDAIDYRGIVLDERKRTIFLQKPSMMLDLGGIAKGLAVDNCIAVLKREGVTMAVVTAGGDSRIIGDRQGRPWMIGVKNPRGDKMAVLLPIVDAAVSTSGDYERFFMDGERRVHHILNPATGRSASALTSVTILADHAIDSDALSTTVFVLGVEKGLALVNRLPGIDAVIIDNAGKLHYSDDLLKAD